VQIAKVLTFITVVYIVTNALFKFENLYVITVTGRIWLTINAGKMVSVILSFHRYAWLKLYALYSSPNIIWAIKSRTVRWAEHVALRGIGEVHTEFWWENLREGDHLEDPCIDARIILKWIFEKWMEGHGLDLSGLGQGQVSFSGRTHKNRKLGCRSSWRWPRVHR
jgi:hypothetical protein